MKLSLSLGATLGFALRALAASSWAGSNLYYAAGLSVKQQEYLLAGLQSADIKVLRVWLDGQSSQQKGSDLDSFSSLEGGSPGDEGGWDDTVLERLDEFMHRAAGYGVKLLISMHSYNTLSAQNDFYGQQYGTDDFYTNGQATESFKTRISHIMDHVNPRNGKAWSSSPEYIFAFEAQNEAMHSNGNPSALEEWQCTMATHIKENLLDSSSILVATGGGAYLDTSLLDGYFTCDALDILSIHAYGDGDFSVDKLSPFVSKALDAGKMLVMQEWGACYYDSPNNRCSSSGALDSATRDANLKKWTDNFGQAGVPWMYWQILPNEDPHQDWDYEVGIDGVNWESLKGAAAAASGYESPFDFAKWLPQGGGGNATASARRRTK